MNIIVNYDSQLAILTEYFDFNRIAYDQQVLWNTEVDPFGRYVIPEQLTDTLLIIDGVCLEQLLDWSVSRQQLLKFCQGNNHLWVFGRFDMLMQLVKINRLLLEFDQDVFANKITLFSEAGISDRCRLLKLKNIKVKTWPYHWQLYMPRIRNAIIDKISPAHDFLLTMIKKRSSPHRQVLWNELLTRPGLLNKGYASFRDSKNYKKTFIGDVTDSNGAPSPAIPSMDLYLSCWLEVVPETLYKNGFFVTEKTIKPIATKTPFLVSSTCGYLDYLRSLGFKTFNTLISESYDKQYRIEDRMRLLVDQLESIIKNSSEDFYHASKPILDHNHNVLAEINGKWIYTMDCFINQCLAEVFCG